MNTTPSEHDIHAYVDGRLDGERRAAVELYLARHPERAAEAQAWQRDAQRLRAALGELPDAAPMLDPAAIRFRRARRRRARLAVAASLLLCLGLGALGGWQARGWRAPGEPPMADAMTAYRLFAQPSAAALDVASTRAEDLQAWLDRRFMHAPRLPDLQAAGFRPVGGRLLATGQGAAALVLYQDAGGHAVAFYLRPPGPRNHLLPQGRREDGGLLALYGSGGGYNVAVVGRAGQAGMPLLRSALDRSI